MNDEVNELLSKAFKFSEDANAVFYGMKLLEYGDTRRFSEPHDCTPWCKFLWPGGHIAAPLSGLSTKNAWTKEGVAAIKAVNGKFKRRK